MQGKCMLSSFRKVIPHFCSEIGDIFATDHLLIRLTSGADWLSACITPSNPQQYCYGLPYRF